MSSSTSQLREPALSVVIPCYRMHASLRRCLDALTSSGDGPDIELIVVDSSGDDLHPLCDAFPHVHFVCLRERTNAATARNIGAARARGRAIAFLDADCVPCPSWLNAARAFALGQNAEAIVEGASPRRRGQAPRSAERVIAAGPISPAPPHSIAGLVLFLVEFGEHVNAAHASSSFAPSCNLVMSRATWQCIGGFPDELARSHDLAWAARATQQGAQFRREKGLAVEHDGPRAVRDVVTHLYRLGFWSARARMHSPSLRGSFLVHTPLAWLLSPLLVPWRGARIVARGACAFAPRTMCVPLLTAALAVWATGFMVAAASSSTAHAERFA